LFDLLEDDSSAELFLLLLSLPLLSLLDVAAATMMMRTRIPPTTIAHGRCHHGRFLLGTGCH
jgi:hypothetical protein